MYLFGKNVNPYCYYNIIVTFGTFLEKFKKNVWMAKSMCFFPCPNLQLRGREVRELPAKNGSICTCTD